MSANKHLTLDMFVAVKTLIKCGSSNAEIAEYLKLSVVTVRRIKSSETYEDYKNRLRAMNAKFAEKKKATAEKAVTPTVVEPPAPVNFVGLKPDSGNHTIIVKPTYEMTVEMRKQTEVLELISRKLTATLDAVNELLACWKSDG